jgi:hypothetical protein
MKRNEQVIEHPPHVEGIPQIAPASTAEQQSAPIKMNSAEEPLLSGSIPPGTPLLPGTISQFPQEFNIGKSESDGSEGGGLDLDYDPTSSDEEKPIELNHTEETLPLDNQLERPEPGIQPAQAEQTIQPPSGTIQSPVGKETIKTTIKPSDQDQKSPLTGKQSPLPGQFNPTGLSPTQWERQKSMFADVLEGYTSPGGTRVNIQNLMMLAFTQNHHEGNSQLNIMTQGQMHISMMAQQKELLEQQAAVIQAGTDTVLAAQKEMIEHLRMKQEEDATKEKEDMVNRSMREEMTQLMTRLEELEMALKMERIKCLEFEKDLLQERENKRRAQISPEEAPDGRRARSTGHALIVDLARSRSPTDNTTSSSGLPLSKKFNPRLMSSVRSKDRQPSQETIDLMILPAPIPGRRTIQPVQEVIQPVQETNQPVQQINQPVQQTNQLVQQTIQPAPGTLHTLQFNRPGSYPRNIIRVERFNRTEQHVDFTVGN